MSKEKMDMKKVLAMLSQPKETPAPLENVERLRLEIPYITKENKIQKRYVQVVMPKIASRPFPLIYIPHYEMGEDAIELRDYLAKGWAVASPAEFDNSYNGMLTDDDLVFNNAALYTLRHRKEFDKNRIILAGGSAGGYMTMMLNGLQLGLCASIANAPITNTYFNFQYYFPKANALNLQALAKIAAQKAAKGEMEAEKSEKTPLEVMQSLMMVPIPFLAGVAGMFAPIGENFPDKEDYQRWEAFSAVGIAECFCSPIMVNHSTSDILVPVDQISRRYTYEKPGDSLEETFDSRLPKDFPGKLKNSLEEVLPKKETRVERFEVPEQAEDVNLPYDSTKRFNINIFDDGPVEGYGSHSARMDVGRRFDVPYLEEMFTKTSAETCTLTPAMLRRLLIRYQGNDVVLPAHRGADNQVYGSLEIYRKEVCEELIDWTKNHTEDDLAKVFDEVLKEEEDNNVRMEIKNTMDEILSEVKQGSI